MAATLLAARLLTAIFLGVAGVAKLADLGGSRASVVEFGIPAPLASLVGLLVPLTELGAAALLLPQRTAWWGASLSLLLLVAFTIGIAANLLRGRKPSCHCFGQLHASSISGWHVARNLALAVPPAAVVGTGQVGMSAFAWLEDARAPEVIGLVVLSLVAAGVVWLIGAVRATSTRQDEILGQLAELRSLLDEGAGEVAVARPGVAAPSDGLPVGAPAPPFTLAAPSGRTFSLSDLCADGRPVLLLFVSPRCQPCRSVLALLERWRQEHGHVLTIAVLMSGTAQEVQAMGEVRGARYLMYVGESPVAHDYHAPWTPSAVVVGPDGRIASGVHNGAEAVARLVERAAARASQAPKWDLAARLETARTPYRIGDSVSGLSLTDLQGAAVAGESLVGREVMLLFWSPRCPHCRAIAGEIAAWQARTTVRLVYVVGRPEHGVDLPTSDLVLVDRNLETSERLLGVSGTPAALLLDARARLASTCANSPAAVLELAGLAGAGAP